MTGNPAGLDWQVEWGLAHDYPQMVFTAVIPVDPAVNEEIAQFYRTLHNRLREGSVYKATP